MILRNKDNNSSQEKKLVSEENVKIENQEKVLMDQYEVWEKSVPSHKVIQKEEKFENKTENILLSKQPLDPLSCKGTLACTVVLTSDIAYWCLVMEGVHVRWAPNALTRRLVSLRTSVS